jgi:hypothetical protein
MHDLDRTQLEYNSQEFEWESEEEGSHGGCCGKQATRNGRVFTEIEEMELAAELLEVHDEDELEQFLGKLIRRAGKAIGKFVKSPVGRVLGGILKGAAMQALPVVGGAISGIAKAAADREPPPAEGGEEDPAAKASEIFGLELEGLSAEDREFESARRFVRYGAEATRQAAAAPEEAPSQAVAREAAEEAANRHAPGLRPGAAAQRRGPSPQRSGRSGRWFRRGNKIVLLGV